MSLQDIRIENKKIEADKQWSEPQSIRDIQVFFGFTNFYRQFIQGFSWIAASLTSMLKTSGSIESKTRSGEGGVGVGGSGGGRDKGGFDRNRIGGGKLRDNEFGKKIRKLSKSKNLSNSDFLTPGARLVFTELR